MTRITRKHRRGFTLMEVLLVLVILVILAGMAVPAYQSLQRSAYMRAARAQIGAFESALEAYHMNMSDYPPTLEGLWQPPMDAGGGGSWEGPYLRRQVTADPWGRPYQYEYLNPEEMPRMYSFGPDGIANNDDDVGNWE